MHHSLELLHLVSRLDGADTVSLYTTLCTSVQAMSESFTRLTSFSSVSPSHCTHSHPWPSSTLAMVKPSLDHFISTLCGTYAGFPTGLFRLILGDVANVDV